MIVKINCYSKPNEAEKSSFLQRSALKHKQIFHSKGYFSEKKNTTINLISSPKWTNDGENEEWIKNTVKFENETIFLWLSFLVWP